MPATRPPLRADGENSIASFREISMASVAPIASTEVADCAASKV
ncbi:hypothetical protein MAUB1S_07114 [Mycolicibacterium aubagnense]